MVARYRATKTNYISVSVGFLRGASLPVDNTSVIGELVTIKVKVCGITFQIHIKQRSFGSEKAKVNSLNNRPILSQSRLAHREGLVENGWAVLVLSSQSVSSVMLV